MTDLAELEKKINSKKTKEALSSSLGSTLSLGMQEFSDSVRGLFGKSSRQQGKRGTKTEKNQIAVDREKFEGRRIKSRKH